jgi:hypothetical protein
MPLNWKRWSVLPVCPSEVDSDASVRAYRLIQAALVALALILYFGES